MLLYMYEVCVYACSCELLCVDRHTHIQVEGSFSYGVIFSTILHIVFEIRPITDLQSSPTSCLAVQRDPGTHLSPFSRSILTDTYHHKQLYTGLNSGPHVRTEGHLSAELSRQSFHCLSSKICPI